jgi:hypothetical protein
MESEFLRIQTRGVWGFICKVCLKTVASASTEEELAQGEAEHECYGSIGPNPLAR